MPLDERIAVMVWLFLKAVGKHWGSIVTGGMAMGLLGIWQGVGHPIKPWVYWLIAIVGLAIAFYRAWLDQYQKVDAIEAARSEIERKYLDERPQLGLRLMAPSSLEAWRSAANANNQQAIFFTLHHLSGRIPTSIRFDPIVSHRGGYSLRFLGIPFVKPPVQVPLFFEVWKEGIKPDLKLAEATCAATKMLEFIWDHPGDVPEFHYTIVARFDDRGEERTHSFPLVFDAVAYKFKQP